MEIGTNDWHNRCGTRIGCGSERVDSRALGGNIDCRDIKEGATLYINCYNDGGLLFVGDVHASQADTEFTGVADETRAELTLRCDVVKNKRIRNPRIENADSIITLCSFRPLEDAAWLC